VLDLDWNEIGIMNNVNLFVMMLLLAAAIYLFFVAMLAL
jgi:hypothetical protein